MKIRVSCTQNLTPEQKIAAGDKVIRGLRKTIKSIVKGKDELVRQAIAAEISAERRAIDEELPGGKDEVLVRLLKQQLRQLKEDNFILKNIARDTQRELKLSEGRVQNMSKEIRKLKKQAKKNQ